MKRNRLGIVAGGLLVACASLTAVGGATPAQAAYGGKHMAINCAYSSLCAEVADRKAVFGNRYVGHDEPSVLFYSNKPGSGNSMQYSLTLPRDPSPSNPSAAGKSYQFELNGAFWFGMAMCDTQSYPEQVSTCPPDSDSNIVDPAVSPNHPGTAFMEMQFYPPGWVPWPTWAVAVGASSCNPTQWCAALNIDSLSENPVNGTVQNPTCASQVGTEYVNFAFITKNGVAQAPANPVDSTLATFTPDPSKDLFMSSGDNLQVGFRDTPDGLRVAINDLTTGQTGSMTASAANGFAQVKYDPTGTSCTALPYNFHPMYSTSSEQTRVIWAAHTYNVAFADEIGHFQTCNGPVSIPATQFGIDSNGNVTTCPAGDTEGTAAGPQPPDGDDFFCFPGSEASLINVSGCTYTNTGFDGSSYQPIWPDGNTALHPEPIMFSSPLTGPHYNVNYPRMGFEADLPAIEQTCDPFTGAGCTLIPTTDSGTPAAFYPYFSAIPARRSGHGCVWALGSTLPGANDFGGNAQYGSLLFSTFLAFGGGGSTVNVTQNFHQTLQPNPCRA